MSDDSYRRAVVRYANGEIILDDPDALALLLAVAKHKCNETFAENADKVASLKERISEGRLTSAQVVITIVNADDFHGRIIANEAMPGFNWQEIRDRGEIPYARGLSLREKIQDFLNFIDVAAADKLRDMNEVAVVVIDHGVAEVFPA